jgi:hypothetical protein
MEQVAANLRHRSSERQPDADDTASFAVWWIETVVLPNFSQFITSYIKDMVCTIRHSPLSEIAGAALELRSSLVIAPCRKRRRLSCRSRNGRACSAASACVIAADQAAQTRDGFSSFAPSVEPVPIAHLAALSRVRVRGVTVITHAAHGTTK